MFNQEQTRAILKYFEIIQKDFLNILIDSKTNKINFHSENEIFSLISKDGTLYFSYYFEDKYSRVKTLRGEISKDLKVISALDNRVNSMICVELITPVDIGKLTVTYRDQSYSSKNLDASFLLDRMNSIIGLINEPYTEAINTIAKHLNIKAPEEMNYTIPDDLIYIEKPKAEKKSGTHILAAARREKDKFVVGLTHKDCAGHYVQNISRYIVDIPLNVASVLKDNIEIGFILSNGDFVDGTLAYVIVQEIDNSLSPQTFEKNSETLFELYKDTVNLPEAKKLIKKHIDAGSIPMLRRYF